VIRDGSGAAADIQASKKPAKKPRKVAACQKGNADADRRTEAGEGECDKENVGKATAPVREP
jgi:hypothetical protein